MVFRTVVKMLISKKPKPKMKPTELNTQLPDQTLTITRALFDIVKEHGPLTIAQTWERLQKVGLKKQVTSKTQMKTVMKWMKERQKLRLICNHVGPHKQFLYTTWFTKDTNMMPEKPTTPRPHPPISNTNHNHTGYSSH